MRLKNQIPLHIDIIINENQWLDIYKDTSELHSLCELVVGASSLAAKLNWPQDAELSLVFTNDNEMAKINGEWRDMAKPTNVLSFPGDDIAVGEDAGPMIGDIIFAHATIIREAHEQGKKIKDHLTHLMVHGFLHLFGYDHIEDDEAEQMEALETKILHALEIDDPYN